MDNKNLVTFQWAATVVELNAPCFRELDYKVNEFYLSKDQVLQTVSVNIFCFKNEVIK